MNEVTGESDPVVKLIDFAHPERNRLHAINQFRIDTPGCVKSSIIPDVVLFVNGLPLVVVEAKIGDANTANPMHAAFEQLLRYRNGRTETLKAGLRGDRGSSTRTSCWCTLRREGRVRHHHLRSRALLCMEGYLAREQPELRSTAWRRA